MAAIRLLVVEDELKALHIIRRGLSTYGYDVTAVSRAGEAIDIAPTFQPHALLTDWLLAGEANGLDVARDLRKHNPELALIFFSGLRLDDLRHAADHLQPCTFIQKPCSFQQLDAALKAALGDIKA